MRINNNISAIIANSHLSKTQNKLSKSLEKLSSGLKINRSADDPAGMAISQKMRTQIRGLSRASQNSLDGISVIETAEGALSEITSMLQRMRELAVQAGNDPYSEQEKEAIQQEADALAAEIDRISKDTEFNKIPLLDGSLDQKGYTDNPAVKVSTFSSYVNVSIYSITVDEIAAKAVAEGNPIDSASPLIDTSVTPPKLAASAAGKLIVNGTTIIIEEGDTGEAVAEKLRKGCEVAGVKFLVVDEGATPSTTEHLENGGYKEVEETFDFQDTFKLVFVSEEYGSSEKIEISCSNTGLSSLLGLPDTSTVIPAGKDAKVSTILTGKGFKNSATVSEDGTKVKITDRNGFSMELFVDVDSKVVGKNVELDITGAGTMTLQVGANEGQIIEIKIPEISTQSLGIENLNYISSVGVGKALERLDAAISKVLAVRSQLGAYQNRLEHANGSLEVTEENMTSALSRIEDVDMAEEMATYTQLNVLSQAGTSMLAQANDLPKTVLQLLQ